MPHWLIKSAIQHVIAALPYRQRWNEFFQEYGSKSLALGPGMFAVRFDHCRTHLENYLSCQETPATSFTALELGTGWFPTIAVGLYLCGAEKVWTVDIDPLLKSSRLQRMVELFREFEQRNELQKYLPLIKKERLAKLLNESIHLKTESAEQFLARFNIQVMVRDAQHTDLPDRSVDLFYSTGVLEYIPRPVLIGILKEFRRLSIERSVMSHWISMIDQFSYFDRSITQYNYLRYSAKQWSYFNSPLIWQSRLRISDYRALIREAGFEITKETSASGDAQVLQTLNISPEFEKYSKEDLSVLTSWLVAKPTKS